MTFNKTYSGAVMRGSATVYSLRPDGVLAGTYVQLGNNTSYYQVGLTGYYITSAKGNQAYQTIDGNYIILSEGWEKVGTMAIMQYSQSQAQALVNTIIKNNQIIICNNLLCARYANKLTSQQQQQVRDLQNRLQERNIALQSGGLTTNIQTSYPQGYNELAPYLDKLMNKESIGVATWVIVVIAATVVAALSTAAYFAYKSLAAQSEQDVKFSKQLTATLTSKLTDAEYQQLLGETKGIVTKARIKQLISTYSSWLAYAAIGVGIYFVYRAIKNRK